MQGTLGFVTMFAGNFAPMNTAFCNGQTIAIQQNAALYSILGNAYGGNGTTNFMLPNLSGRVAIGGGQGPGLTNRVLGATGGEVVHTLTLPEIPAHTHVCTYDAKVTATAVLNAGASGNSGSPAGRTLGSDGNTAMYAPATAAKVPMAANEATITDAVTAQPTGITLGSYGGNGAHTNMQPYLVTNFVICISGDFPQRP